MGRRVTEESKNNSKNIYTQLTDYIQKIYLDNGYTKEEINWVIITAQINNFKKKYDYTYAGMLYTLKYITELKGENLCSDAELYDGSILNLLPFSYEEAMMFYNRTQNIKKQVEQNDFKDIINNVTYNKKKLVQDKKKKFNLTFD